MHKGQKCNKYSPELKQQMVDKYLSGDELFSELKKKHNIPSNTIVYWVKETKKGRDITKRKTYTRSKNVINLDYKEKYEILKNYQAFLKAQREKK